MLSAILLSELLVLCGSASSRKICPDYYISQAIGSDATGTGSYRSPWGTISHAVGELTSTGIDCGTLHVGWGVYPEVVDLPRDINLIGCSNPSGHFPFGDGENTTIIKGVGVSGGNRVSDVVLRARGLSTSHPALKCSGTGEVYISRCWIYLSRLDDFSGGPGLCVLGSSSPRLEDCVFRSNSAPGSEGNASKGGAAWIDCDGETKLVRCRFEGNSATYGGGIYASRGTVICRDCVFTNNVAGSGSSIYATRDTNVTLVNCRFTDNRLDHGGEVAEFDLKLAGNSRLINCTLAGTQDFLDTADIGGFLVANCILRGSRIRLGYATTVLHSNIEGYDRVGLGNIDEAPLFVNPAAGDYRLLPSSPCVDTGTSAEAPDHDLAGKPRPFDVPGAGSDGPGQGYDMGCYEYREEPDSDGDTLPDDGEGGRSPDPNETNSHLDDSDGDGLNDLVEAANRYPHGWPVPESLPGGRHREERLRRSAAQDDAAISVSRNRFPGVEIATPQKARNDKGGNRSQERRVPEIPPSRLHAPRPCEPHGSVGTTDPPLSPFRKIPESVFIRVHPWLMTSRLSALSGSSFLATQPRNRDSDGDFYEDGIEAFLLGSNPANGNEPEEALVDADGDALPASHDPDDENPEIDGDRFPDGYEAVMLGLDAATEIATVPPLGDPDGTGTVDNADAQWILNFFACMSLTLPLHCPEPAEGAKGPVGGQWPPYFLPPESAQADFVAGARGFNRRAPLAYLDTGGLSTNPMDPDRNGVIDNADSQAALSFFAGLIPVLPVERSR